MAKYTGRLAIYPAQALFRWYIGLIGFGTLLLMLPICAGDEGVPISWLDALFTATSAACVTGLSVRSTGHAFSFWGQASILLLVQIGGIGIITLTTLITSRLGGKAGLRDRAVIAETLSGHGEQNLAWILRRVLLTVVTCELIGTALLLPRFHRDLPLPDAVWYAMFHSVSAFCNAGFGINDQNLTPFQGDVVINLTIIFLIVIGGLGFPVILDLQRMMRAPVGQRWEKLQVHSKLMLIGTAGLLSIGAGSFLLLEQENVLRGMPAGRQMLVALFHSTTARTAGFNTIDVAALTNATLFITVILMIIGAGPCSTAGGLKVSTMMVLAANSISRFRGYDHLAIFRRNIPGPLIDRALATAFLFGLVAAMGLTAMCVVEQSDTPRTTSGGLFLDATFEVVSALGTVGLSTGLTAQLTAAGRLILIAMMFIGRIGPITVFVAMSQRSSRARFDYPKEDVLIG
jgi:trk system potassium uptake protein TrkH